MSKRAFSVQDAQSAGFSAGGKLPYPAFAEVVWTVLLRIIPIIQGEAASPSQSLRDSSPKGRALGSPRKLPLFAKASPLGRDGCERSEQMERARLLSCRAAASRSEEHTLNSSHTIGSRMPSSA